MAEITWNGIDLDGGIDWSSIRLPGEEEVEIIRDSSLGTHHPHANSMITENHSSVPVSSLPPPQSQAIGSRNYHFSGSTIHREGTGKSPSRFGNNDPAASTGVDHLQHGQEMMEMRQKIEKLENVLADKDARLFDLESTMATVEAEAAYQIQQGQVQLQQQLRACQDQLRQLEKDLDLKNQLIVKLKKRHRKEDPMAQAQLYKQSKNELERFEGQSPPTFSKPLMMDKPRVDRVMDDDDHEDTHSYNQPCHGRIDESSHVTNEPKTQTNDDVANSHALLQNHDFPEHAVPATADRMVGNTRRIFDDIDEMKRVTLHLYFYVERFLPNNARTFGDFVVDSSNNASQSVSSNFKQDQNIQAKLANGAIPQHSLIDVRENVDSFLQIRSLLLNILQHSKVPDCDARRTSVQHCEKMLRPACYNKSFNMDVFSKEILTMISLAMEEDLKIKENGNKLHQCHEALSYLSIVKEFCVVSPRGRDNIREWLCRSSQRMNDHVNLAENNREQPSPDLRAVSRIRGLPEEYEKEVYTVQLHMRGQTNEHLHGYWDDDFAIICDSFRKGLVSCIVGPSPEQWEGMCYTQRAQVEAFQLKGLEFLHMIIHDASESQLMAFYDILFHCNPDNTVPRDIISILEKSTVFSMNECGHRQSLIKEDMKRENTPFYNSSVDDVPEISILKRKINVLQVLTQISLSPHGIRSLMETLDSCYYGDSVSNLKRIVAAMLDDLHLVVLPRFTCQDNNLHLETTILQFAYHVFRMLTNVSKSMEGFDLVRTQMCYFTANIPTGIHGTSCIAIGVDIYELSAHQLLYHSGSTIKNMDIPMGTWQHLYNLVQSLVTFFYSVYTQCLSSSGYKTSKAKESLAAILLDANRCHSFIDSCRKVASIKEICTSETSCRTIDPSILLKAGHLLQALKDV